MTDSSAHEAAARTAYDLLVVGDANLDIQLSPASAQLAFGQEELLVESGSLTLGGSGAITACAAARATSVKLVYEDPAPSVGYWFSSP